MPSQQKEKTPSTISQLMYAVLSRRYTLYGRTIYRPKNVVAYKKLQISGRRILNHSITQEHFGLHEHNFLVKSWFGGFEMV